MNPNTQLATRQPQQVATKPRALEIMAARVSVPPEKMLATLKGTVFKGATDDELLALVVVSNEYGLNPFLREIYAFPKKGGGICPVVSIDGWIKMINRRPDFDGVQFSMVDDQETGKPFSCTCKLTIKGRAQPVEVTEYFEECYRDTDPWRTMPRRMLRHKALSQCARVAFGFSGVADDDEALDVSSVVRMADDAPAPQPKAMPPQDDGDLAPQTDPAPSTAKIIPIQAMTQFLDENKIGVGIFMAWGEQSGNITAASFDEIPEADFTRLLRNSKGLAIALNKFKAETMR